MPMNLLWLADKSETTAGANSIECQIVLQDTDKSAAG